MSERSAATEVAPPQQPWSPAPPPARRPAGGRWLAAVSALLALAAVVVALLSLRTGHDLSPGPDAPVTGGGATAIIDANNSPTIAVNPIHPSNIVEVNRVDRPTFSADLHWTLDGGATWSSTALPLPAGRDRPYAPEAVFDPDGVLYVLYVNLEGNGNDPQTVWLARSHDGGRTLEAPVAVAGRLSFQARLAVDGRGHVYVTWLRASSVGTLSITGPAVVVCATSGDGGSTFSPPVQVSDAQRARVGAAVPVVDSSGSLVVLYEDFKGDVRDFQNLAGPTWTEPFTLVAARSTSQGKAFSQGVEVDTGLVPTERFLVYLPRFPSVAAAADGSLYAAWSDGRTGGEQVFVRRSTDSGQTWGAAVQVPAGPEGAAAWMPKLSVAPDGRVDVAYLAGHRDGDARAEAWLASSDDQAGSFQAVRVSSSSFDTRIGPLTGPEYLAPDLGSKLGLESTDEAAVVAWVDTRQGTRDSGRQDVYVGRVEERAAGVSALRVGVIAALLVLSAVVLLPLLLERRAARRERPG